MTDRVNWKNVKILLAEDNPGMTTTIGVFLCVVGAGEFEFCSSGEEAPARFEQENRDVVITDCNMALMDSLTLVEKIRHRRNGKAARVPATMITGLTEADRVVAVKKPSIAQVLGKPFRLAEIRDRIEWSLTNRIDFVLGGDQYVVANLGRPHQQPDIWRCHKNPTRTLLGIARFCGLLASVSLARQASRSQVNGY